VSGAAAARAAASANDEIAERGSIFTYLLDTGSASAAQLPPAALAAKEGWSIVAEGAGQGHAFAGDRVVLNDKVALVFRAGSGGAEVYAGGTAPVFRAALLPVSSGGEAAARLAALEIGENGPAAVAVVARFETASGQPLAMTYRLTTGQIQVEMKPGPTVDAVRVLAESSHVVVPDFFADDLVYSPDMFAAPWAGLAAENFYLHLAGGGGAILTCLWESTGRNARALFSDGAEGRTIAGSEIECAPEKSVWVAFFEHEDAWHEAALPEGAREADFPLDWTPPFEATWRGNFPGGAEQAQSWDFREGRLADYRRPGRAPIVYPCWMASGRATLRLPEDVGTPPSIVIYPLERTRATPLSLYVLVDVMRNTLGMGPCQYILDMEGLDAASSPTPALVCDWVESRLRRGRAESEAEKINERLAAMAEHVAQSEARIARYEDFRGHLAEWMGARGFEGEALGSLLSEMADTIGRLAAARGSSGEVRALSGRLADLLGAAEWEEEFQAVSADLHALGAAQDRTLSVCRMSLRRLKQHALMAAHARPEMAPFAREMGAKIDAFLYGKQ